MGRLVAMALALAGWPLLWAGLLGDRLGFSAGTLPDVLRRCVDTLLLGEATSLLALGALLLPAIWFLVGIAVRMAWLSHRTHRQVRALSRRLDDAPARLVDAARDIGVVERLDYYSDVRIYAFVHGVLRPRIVVSSGLLDMLSDVEIRAVLRHEEHHLRRWHVVRHLIRDALRTTLAFVPVARALADRDRLENELAADRHAAIDRGVVLAGALLKLARQATPAPLAPSATSELEARIRAVGGERPPALRLPRWWWLPLASSIAVLSILLVGHATGWYGLELHVGLPVGLDHVLTTSC